MADDGIEAALIKEANPFIDDLAEAVVHALRRDKRTNLPYVQTYPELGLANSTTRQTLPAEITWLLLYSAANAAPDLTLDIQGIVIPVTSFPAQIQLPLWGATVTLTNNDSANNVTVVATDRPILPQVAAAGGSSGSPLYTEATGSLAPHALASGDPVTLLTIPYTSFSASTTLYPQFVGKLHRNAIARTFMVANGLNQPLTTATLTLFESTAPVTGALGDSYAPGAVNNNGQLTMTSENHPALAAHVDSGQVALGMGATAPTSGDVYVLVTEVL